MARIYTKSCPNCGNMYYRTTYKRVDFGSPFIRCSRCGTDFFDKSRIEPATKPYKPVGYVGSYLSNICYSLIFSILPFGIAVNGNVHIAIRIASIAALIAISLFFIGGCKKRTDMRNLVSEKEWLQSKERLSDPKYIELLRKINDEGIESILSETQHEISMGDFIDPDAETRKDILKRMRSQASNNMLKK